MAESGGELSEGAVSDEICEKVVDTMSVSSSLASIKWQEIRVEKEDAIEPEMRC